MHRTTYCWTEGDEPSKGRVDFGVHIVATTSDHTVNWPFAGSLIVFGEAWRWRSAPLLTRGSGLFNHHVLHHLFPAVDMSRFTPEIRAILIQTCKDAAAAPDADAATGAEFNVPYSPCSVLSLFWDSFSGVLRQHRWRGHWPTLTTHK